MERLAGVEPGVVDAVVVRTAPRAGATQLVEHVAGVGGPYAGGVQAAGELGPDPQLVAHAGRRVHRATTSQHPTLEVRHRALLLGPLRDRQDDVGQERRLRGDDVAHDHEVEGAEALPHGTGVGGADDEIGAVHEQRARTAGVAERAQQLYGRHAGAWEGLGVDAPHGGDVGPGGVVLDRAVAGKLVGLLAVLASALSVALARDGAVPAAFGTHESQRERERDGRGDGGGAVGVLLHAAAGQHEGAGTPAVW